MEVSTWFHPFSHSFVLNKPLSSEVSRGNEVSVKSVFLSFAFFYLQLLSFFFKRLSIRYVSVPPFFTFLFLSANFSWSLGIFTDLGSGKWEERIRCLLKSYSKADDTRRKLMIALPCTEICFLTVFLWRLKHYQQTTSYVVQSNKKTIMLG